jgi:hypothetical protein
MSTDPSGTEANSNEEAVPSKTGRPPPVILTSTTNQIQLQKQLQNVVKENFEFRILETEPESSREAWLISNSSNRSSTPITSPITRSLRNRINYEGGDTPPVTQHPCRRHI